MRLHHLEITAFGPFAGPEHVDFDSLSTGGIFLLSGPTGAGKSSVLDAVCFALYGQVPGDRRAADQVRSDHADPEVAPEVALELTLAGRRLRVVRSPRWMRPKRRGAGMTPQQARVVVSECVDDEWVALTNRLDEAGHLLGGLLGMTLDQFTQVAMLPQGHFQRFLRASSSERHELLQRVFHTERFGRVTDWLAGHRRELGRDSERHAAAVSGTVNRMLESSGTAAPAHWSGSPVESYAEELPGWADELAAGLRDRQHRAADSLALAETEHRRADEAARAATRLAHAQRQGSTARATLARLDQTSAEAAEAESRLTAHRRAGLVLACVTVADRARQRSERAREAAVARLEAAALLLDRPTEDLADAHRLAEAEQSARDQLAHARTFVEIERRLKVARAEVDAKEEATARATAARTEVGQILGTLPQRVQDLAQERARLAPIVQRAPELRLSLEETRRVVAASAELERVRTELADADEQVGLAERGVTLARDTLVAAREARIRGLAAELAAGLAVGQNCPVCGSCEHPAPATAHGDAAADERAAQRALDDAHLTAELALEKRRTLTSRVETLRQRGGTTTEQNAMEAMEQAAALLDEADAAATRLTDVEQELAELRARLDAARDRQAPVHAQAATATEAERLARAVCAEHEGALSAFFADYAGDTVDGVITSLDESARAVHEAGRSWLEQVDALRAADEAEEAALSAALEHDFADLDGVRAAALDAAQADQLQQQLDKRREARAAAEAVLVDEEVAAALAAYDADGPVGSQADLAAVQTRQRLDLARTADARATERADRMDALVTELRDLLDLWRPIRERHELVAGLASFTAGTSADNHQRITLTAYVLLERLRQVVAAANERLVVMTDQQFSLAHSIDRGAGETKGGLSLRVCDAHTGTERDPATLSGGETFIVSLALALGLADVVGREAGGTDIDTLFVDEGFGSLDADTLDRVLDTLDSLREGGRVVGVVSHVEEMRGRIPTQLLVHKSRRGSTLEMPVVR